MNELIFVLGLVIGVFLRMILPFLKKVNSGQLTINDFGKEYVIKGLTSLLLAFISVVIVYPLLPVFDAATDMTLLMVAIGYGYLFLVVVDGTQKHASTIYSNYT